MAIAKCSVNRLTVSLKVQIHWTFCRVFNNKNRNKYNRRFEDLQLRHQWWTEWMQGKSNQLWKHGFGLLHNLTWSCYHNEDILLRHWPRFTMKLTKLHLIHCFVSLMEHLTSFSWIFWFSINTLPIVSGNLVQIHVVSIHSSGGSRISQTAAPTYYYAFFSWKLHYMILKKKMARGRLSSTPHR